MTFSKLTDALTVPSGASVAQAVSLALAHFGCGKSVDAGVTGQYRGLLLPSFTLIYRGAAIPVSLEDTTQTLTRRAHFYLDTYFPTEAAA